METIPSSLFLLYPWLDSSIIGEHTQNFPNEDKCTLLDGWVLSSTVYLLFTILESHQTPWGDPLPSVLPAALFVFSLYPLN